MQKPKFEIGDAVLLQREFVLIESVIDADAPLSSVEGVGYIVRFNDDRPVQEIAELVINYGVSLKNGVCTEWRRTRKGWSFKTIAIE